MSDAQASNAVAPQTDRVRFFAIAVYALYLAALLNGVTAIIGVVLAYIMRGDARGTIYESHFANAIQVFWVAFLGLVALSVIALVLVIAGFGGVGAIMAQTQNAEFNAAYLLIVPVVGLAVLGLTIWYLYRTVTGLVHALENKPV
jgi:uncharacterized membrane protein